MGNGKKVTAIMCSCLLTLAMKNAYKLLNNSEDLSYSDKWPATNVVKFFEEYAEYIK